MSKFISLVLLLSLAMSQGHASGAAAQAAPAPSYQTTQYLPPPPPPLDPRPRSGLGGLIVGIAGLAGGAGALLIIPVCYSSAYPSAGTEVCAIGQGVVGALGITAGIIGLSIGLPRRARYKEWKARQRAQPSAYGELDLSSTPGGAGLRYQLAF